MPLISSNTYIEPTPGTALNTARGQYNDTLRSILTNFKSTSQPASVNLTAVGAAIGEQDGMLYRSATTNALYISDSVHVKSSPVGGNFTRIGIGNRIENGIVALGANADSYEIGELVATVSQGAVGSNARLYLCVSNTGAAPSTSRFLDVGAPLGYTIGTLSNASFSGQSLTAITLLATSNVGIGTSSPTQTLDVKGNANIASNVFIGNFTQHIGDVVTYFGFPAATTNTITLATSGVNRLYINANGNVGIGTTTSTANLSVIGNVAATTDIVASQNVSAIGLVVPNGTTQFNLHLKDNNILTPGYNGTANVQVNYSGYLAGTTQFRNFVVFDGKNSVIGTFTGSTGNFVASGTIAANSDERLKTNIKTIDNALNKVNNMRGVYFNKDGIPSTGVIAQEIEQILPEVVVNSAEYKSVAYGNIVGILIEAIKELAAKVAELENNK